MKYTKILNKSLLVLSIVCVTFLINNNNLFAQERVKTPMEEPGIGYYIFFIVMLFLLLGLFFYFKKQFAYLKRKIKKLEGNYLMVANKPSVNQKDLQIQVGQLTKTLNDFTNNFQEKYDEIVGKFEKTQRIFLLKKDGKNDINQSNRNDREHNDSIFYLSELNSDNSFSMENKSDTQNVGSIYKFIIKDGSEQASFEFVSEIGSMGRMHSAKEVFINPVAEEKNIFSQQVKRIITEQPGVAQKQNGKWVVKQKAIIRYE